MKAKKVHNQAAQGDVLFRRVELLPKNVKLHKQKGVLVVAHSETGHDHIVQDKNVVMYDVPNDPMIAYLVASNSFEVHHHRSFDSHAPLLLYSDNAKESIWEIRRQREHTPAGWRRVED